MRSAGFATSLLALVAMLASACGSDGTDDDASDPTTSNPVPSTVASVMAPGEAGPGDVRFVPVVSSAGGVITVQGFGWPDGPINIYLLPVSDSDQLMMLIESGGVAAFGQAAASAGTFTARLVVPAVQPGEYVIAAQGPGGIAQGVTNLTIR